jgi:hypothetical protein
MDWRPVAASLAFERRAASVALDIHLEDGGVMDEAVDDGDRDCLLQKNLAPFAEWLVAVIRRDRSPGADDSSRRRSASRW